MISTHMHTVHDLRNPEQTEALKPIVPELCLDTIWVDNSTARDFNEPATHGFLHVDLIGQIFLCYLTPHTFKLNLIKLDKEAKSSSQMFGMVTSISAKDAVDLKVSKNKQLRS